MDTMHKKFIVYPFTQIIVFFL